MPRALHDGPHKQVKATKAQLVSSYNYFVAHTIDLDEPSTLIYIRGKQHGSQSIASLRAVPNELVLWPQIWGSANVIGKTGFELDTTINHNHGKEALLLFARRTDTNCYLSQSPSVLRQYSTPRSQFQAKTVIVMLLSLPHPQSPIRSSLCHRSKTGVISSNTSARIPL